MMIFFLFYFILLNKKKAKYALYEICFSKFLEYLSTINSKIGNIFENLHDAHAIIFNDMSS